MGYVRIVGGSLRGRRLRVPERGVRPTAERVREAVFDILGTARLEGARVLELYAGTGALGVEALSRGAARADFVEGHRAVAGALRGNLARLGLADRSSVHLADLGGAALPATLHGPWDVVFLDPPYAGDEGARWLEALGRIPWPAEGGLVVLERRRGALAAPEGLALLSERRYGDTVVGFYRAGPAGAGAPGREQSREGRGSTAERRRMRHGVFAGTFDPVTNGHLDIMHRALRIVDHLTVAVAERVEKGVLFPWEERVAMIREATRDLDGLDVQPFTGLLVDWARARDIGLIIRGIRFISDFEYEFQMALMNRRLVREIETVFLMPNETWSVLNSTLVKEIARHGGAAEEFVPPNVARKLRERFGGMP